MRYLAFIFCLVLLFPFNATAQQTDNEKWYFAYNRDTGVLMAFSTAGASHILLQAGVSNELNPSTRLNDEQALVSLNFNGSVGLYRLSPDEAVLVQEGENQVQSPLAATDGAAVMIGRTSGQPIPAVLFTSDLMRELPNYVDGSRTTVRFSKDGQFFRYLGFSSSGEWSLWEHSVASGAEKQLFTFGSDYPVIRPDVGGENWLWRSENEGQAEYQLIHLDGTVEALGTFDESQSRGSFYPLGNSLIAYPAECESTCTVEVRSVDQTLTFQGSPDVYRALPLNLTPAGDLLVDTVHDELFLLHPDAPPDPVGYFFNDSTLNLFSARFLANSPDGRWLISVENLDDPAQYQVIDLLSGEVVASYDIYSRTNLQRIRYGDGVVVFEMEGGDHDFLIYDEPQAEATLQHYSQAEGGFRSYFVMLPNQQALYDGTVGVFLHDFAADQTRMLVEGDWKVIGTYTLDLR